MSEKEKILRAKQYIDKLANGINPLTNAEVPSGDTINDVRISRYLFYISDILGEMLDKDSLSSEKAAEKPVVSKPAEETKAPQVKKPVYIPNIEEEDEEEEELEEDDEYIPFHLTNKQKKKFHYSDDPITISEVTNRLNKVAKTDDMEPLLYTDIVSWLEENGFLSKAKLGNGKVGDIPTKNGERLGIVLRTKIGKDGVYNAIQYNEKAQQFIVENINYITGAEEAEEADETDELADVDLGFLDEDPTPESLREEDFGDYDEVMARKPEKKKVVFLDDEDEDEEDDDGGFIDDFEKKPEKPQSGNICETCFNRIAGICNVAGNRSKCDDFEPNVKNFRELKHRLSRIKDVKKK